MLLGPGKNSLKLQCNQCTLIKLYWYIWRFLLSFLNMDDDDGTNPFNNMDDLSDNELWTLNK